MTVDKRFIKKQERVHYIDDGENIFEWVIYDTLDNNKVIVYTDMVKEADICCNLLNELHEERNYFKRKKCEYGKKNSILTTDKITLKSIMEDTETLMELVKEQDKLIDLKMKPETVQLLTQLEKKIDYYKKVHERKI